MHGNFRRELTFDSGREMRITQNWGHKLVCITHECRKLRVWCHKLEFLGFTPETDIDQWIVILFSCQDPSLVNPVKFLGLYGMPTFEMT